MRYIEETITKHGRVRIGDLVTIKSDNLNKALKEFVPYTTTFVVQSIFECDVAYQKHPQVFVSKNPNATTGYYVEEIIEVN